MGLIKFLQRLNKDYIFIRNSWGKIYSPRQPVPAFAVKQVVFVFYSEVEFK